MEWVAEYEPVTLALIRYFYDPEPSTHKPLQLDFILITNAVGMCNHILTLNFIAY